MNGIHDMGGMQDMGPVRREPDEPTFHAPWERRMFALFNALDLEWPTLRSQIDLIPPADYLRISYYERWLAAIGPLMVQAGMATRAELDAGRPIGTKNTKFHVLTAPEVATWIQPAANPETPPSVAPGFREGQRVRARTMNPTGHTRLPRYVRGRSGTIERDRGVEDFPDTQAQGLGKKPQHLYVVRFKARELWGDRASVRDAVYLDLWEDYLEPA
jgi:nitrile hydratase